LALLLNKRITAPEVVAPSKFDLKPTADLCAAAKWPEWLDQAAPYTTKSIGQVDRSELANDTGVLKTAKLVGHGTGTEKRLKQAMMVA